LVTWRQKTISHYFPEFSKAVLPRHHKLAIPVWTGQNWEIWHEICKGLIKVKLLIHANAPKKRI
jgi:hypothetical protein